MYDAEDERGDEPKRDDPEYDHKVSTQALAWLADLIVARAPEAGRETVMIAWDYLEDGDSLFQADANALVWEELQSAFARLEGDNARQVVPLF
jgi:hypothetical protein